MAEQLSQSELIALVERVFAPGKGDKGLAILIDLPDAHAPDNADWAMRRLTALAWHDMLKQAEHASFGPVRAIMFRNAHTNNGELPAYGWIYNGGPLPASVDDLPETGMVAFDSVFAGTSIFLAPTQFSATAPLKGLARKYGFRAATMGGFRHDMIPALRIDYGEVNHRVDVLKALLDKADGCDIAFTHPQGEARLHLDLRCRTAHASGGLLRQPGMAGNLPSGEAYIVPNEGESVPSKTAGLLPVQFGDEVVLYRIVANRAMEVVSSGPASAREADHLTREPAYGNIAELGLGVLAAFGVKPVGKVLLDEKLGLHIAFGRSEHFGGEVGPKDFSSPEAIIHIDRVYIPETQPQVRVKSADLTLASGEIVPLMRDGAYVIAF